MQRNSTADAKDCNGPSTPISPLIVCVCALVGSLLSQTPAAAAERDVALDLSPGFPRTIFFRSEKALRQMSPEDAIRAIEPFDAISLKLFNEAARQRYRDLLPVIQALKRRKPRMPVLVHVHQFAAVRPLEGSRLSPGQEFDPYDPEGVFPGHWLYYPGSRITRPVGLDDTEIHVEDAAKFSVADDVRVWPDGALEQPRLWHESEVVFVEAVDEAKNVLTVQRGKYGTAPRKFRTGATATPHCKLKHGAPVWHWCYNLAPQCPRDEAGRTFIAWFAEWLATELKRLNAEAGTKYLDGIEFDVTKFNLTFGTQPLEGLADQTPKPRTPDCNLDGIGDGGYIDGQPAHGFGTIRFAKLLREALGPEYLITGDSIWTLWRPWPYANGMDNESFPDIRKGYRFSGAFERTLDWQRYCAEPRMSFFFTRSADDRLPGQKDAYQTLRLALAAAVATDCWHCTSQLPGGDPRHPDEYDGGDLRRRHWLGRPLGDFVRVPQYRPNDLIDYGSFDTDAQVARAQVAAEEGYVLEGPTLDGRAAHRGAGCLRVTTAGLPQPPGRPRSFEACLRLPVQVEGGKEYTLDFWARAEHDYAKREPACEGIPWGLTLALWSGASGRTNTGQHCLLIPDIWRHYRISIVANPGSPEARFQFELGAEPGTLWLDDMHVYDGGADAFYRRFEGGLVLANGTRRPVEFDLASIEPARRLRRLQATQVDGKWQSDPGVNTGAEVRKAEALEVGAFDAVFLVGE